MPNEVAKFKCPVAVALYMKEIGYKVDVVQARRNRAAYQRQQRIVSRNIERWGLEKKSELPPCCDCHPEVFEFCSNTGTVCTCFTMYSTGGKNKKHSCAERLRKQVNRYAELVPYCEYPSLEAMQRRAA